MLKWVIYSILFYCNQFSLLMNKTWLFINKNVLYLSLLTCSSSYVCKNFADIMLWIWCHHNGFHAITFVLVDWSFQNFSTVIIGTEYKVGIDLWDSGPTCFQRRAKNSKMPEILFPVVCCLDPNGHVSELLPSLWHPSSSHKSSSLTLLDQWFEWCPIPS